MHSGQFFVYGEKVSLDRRVFNQQDDARREAEKVARRYPGQTIHVAYIAASVVEPLMPLIWDQVGVGPVGPVGPHYSEQGDACANPQQAQYPTPTASPENYVTEEVRRA